MKQTIKRSEFEFIFEQDSKNPTSPAFAACPGALKALGSSPSMPFPPFVVYEDTGQDSAGHRYAEKQGSLLFHRFKTKHAAVSCIGSSWNPVVYG